MEIGRVARGSLTRERHLRELVSFAKYMGRPDPHNSHARWLTLTGVITWRAASSAPTESARER